MPAPDPINQNFPTSGSGHEDLADFSRKDLFLTESFSFSEVDIREWQGDSLQDALSPNNPSALERFAPAWSELLIRAVEEPGLICDAYTRFHGYSLGNRFAALIQCELRGLEPGPLNSFGGWRKLGYVVKEGEKALTLCMPIKGKLHREKSATDEDKATLPPGCPPDVEEIEYIRAFTWKPNWFVLSQTAPLDENTPALPTPSPLGWDQAKALETLGITQVPFNLLDGNALGFARQREIAVSPLSPYPFKTLFHEMAHIVLGHTTDNFRGEGNTGLNLSDGDELERNLIEVEAESVALMLLATLDLPGQEYCRGYIQHWLSGGEIPEKSAQRIFGAADRMLGAGVGEVRPRALTAEEVGLMPHPTSNPSASSIHSPIDAALGEPIIGKPIIGKPIIGTLGGHTFAPAVSDKTGNKAPLATSEQTVSEDGLPPPLSPVVPPTSTDLAGAPLPDFPRAGSLTVGQKVRPESQREPATLRGSSEALRTPESRLNEGAQMRVRGSRDRKTAHHSRIYPLHLSAASLWLPFPSILAGEWLEQR